MKKGIVLSVLFIFQWANSPAQNLRRVIHLDKAAPLHHIRHIPFNRVVVYDNRFDTTKVGIVERGNMPFQIVVFDKPASLVIGKYMEKAISRHARTNRTLYVNLLQLRFDNIPGDICAGEPIYPTLFISADAYYSTDRQQFKRVLSMKMPVDWTFPVFGSAYEEPTIKKALTIFIEAICSADARTAKPDTSIYTSADIHAGVVSHWAAYPINTQPLFSNGIYLTFADFIKNRITPADLSLDMGTDSMFTLHLADSFARSAKENKISSNSIWGGML
jgi:hypothetical protein